MVNRSRSEFFVIRIQQPNITRAVKIKRQTWEERLRPKHLAGVVFQVFFGLRCRQDELFRLCAERSRPDYRAVLIIF